MIDLIQVTTGIFGWCTRLFPREFRQNFGEELQGVFTSMVEDSARNGGLWGLLKVFGRELRDLPGSLFHEHLALLRKKLGLDPGPGPVSPWRSARQAALGFAIAQALLILIRWFSDPANDLGLRNYGLGLLRETLLFAMVGGIGWFMLGKALFPDVSANRLAVRGIFFGALGGLLSTLLIGGYYKYIANIYTSARIPIQFLAALVYGAFFGAPLVWEAGFRGRRTSLLITAAACFGIGFWFSEAMFLLYSLLRLPYEWQLRYWGIPLAVCSPVDGWVSGTLWGWAVGSIKARQAGRDGIRIDPAVQRD
jgi:hypothetical protein